MKIYGNLSGNITISKQCGFCTAYSKGTLAIFSQQAIVSRGDKIAESLFITYIRWEMTPTSIGGEKQVSISGGSQSPILYSLRQDYRGAQLKYVMQLHDAHLATRMPEHS